MVALTPLYLVYIVSAVPAFEPSSDSEKLARKIIENILCAVAFAGIESVD